MLKIFKTHAPLLILLFLAACATKPASDVDTPEYHYKAGMRAIENEDFQQAIKSFQRSIDLDKKFALGYGGLGLAHAAIIKRQRIMRPNVPAEVKKTQKLWL